MKKIIKKIIIFFRLTFLLRLKNDLYHWHQYLKLVKYFKYTQKNMENKGEIKNSENIWVFWWQGKKQMPPIVKACYKSVLKHANGHTVVLITKDNYKKFTDIDENILKKLKKNYISLTAFSDVMRFNLLKNNGGLWLDATVYVNDDIKEEYFGKFFTVGVSDIYHEYMSSSYSGFLLGGCNNDVIKFVNDFIKVYYKHNDYVIFYYLIDIALFYCYKKNIDGFRDYVDNNSFNSDPNLHALAPLLNKNYDSSVFNKINNRFYKLTYKMDFDDVHDTFYHRIIHNEEPFA